jgi:putative DNA primase/helicase
MAFLRQVLPDNEGQDGKASRFCLQEIFGLMLTPDTSFQKAFLMKGRGRSGRGTIGRVLTALVGRENVAAPTLAQFGTDFGCAELIGKRVAIIGDARLGQRANAHAVVERMLSITGEDTQTINRKFKPHWTGRLDVRFIILTNELPRLLDASQVIASRFIVLLFNETFYGRENRKLTAELLTELPGILNWSLAGLDRLRKRGHFVMPKSSEDALRQLQELASPVGAFVNEWCMVGPKGRASISRTATRRSVAGPKRLAIRRSAIRNSGAT